MTWETYPSIMLAFLKGLLHAWSFSTSSLPKKELIKGKEKKIIRNLKCAISVLILDTFEKGEISNLPVGIDNRGG